MAYRGHIENGVVVLDEPADIQEGTVVSVAVTGKQEAPVMTTPGRRHPSGWPG